MNAIDIGGVLQRTIDLYTKNLVRLIIVAAIINVPLALVSIGTTQLPTVIGLLATPMELALRFVGGAVLAGMLVAAVRDAKAGAAEKTPGELFDTIKPMFGALLLTALFVGILSGIGFVFCILPGLVLMTWWAVATPVVVTEGKSGWTAMARSKELIDPGFLSGQFWPVLLILAIIGIVGFVVGGIIGIPLAIAGGPAGTAISQLIVGTVISPLTAVASVLIYDDLTGSGDAGQGAVTPSPAAPPMPPADVGGNLPPAP
jgi:hypothetical protein